MPMVRACCHGLMGACAIPAYRRGLQPPCSGRPIAQQPLRGVLPVAPNPPPPNGCGQTNRRCVGAGDKRTGTDSAPGAIATWSRPGGPAGASGFNLEIGRPAAETRLPLLPVYPEPVSALSSQGDGHGLGADVPGAGLPLRQAAWLHRPAPAPAAWPGFAPAIVPPHYTKWRLQPVRVTPAARALADASPCPRKLAARRWMVPKPLGRPSISLG